MNAETFNKLLDELDGNSLETLKQKNAKYASADDCLHNFESGAEIMGSTPAQCAWGYMTKHLVALRDKVQRNDFGDRDDLLEKCQDIINYIRFIWLIGNEEGCRVCNGQCDGCAWNGNMCHPVSTPTIPVAEPEDQDQITMEEYTSVEETKPEDLYEPEYTYDCEEVDA